MATRQKYRINGMHCGSCEILIENTFSKMSGVKQVNASTKLQCAVIDYEDKPLKLNELNRAVQKHGYTVELDDDSSNGPTVRTSGWKSFFTIAGVLLGAWLLFRSGANSLVSVNSASSIPTFFLFGIIAGLSTCAALVGGIVLAMSKQWLSLYGEQATAWEKLEPHWQFNLGRLISYTVLGAVLGLVGGALRPSAGVTTALTLVVSAIMILLALQMLGIKGFDWVQIRLPKFITRRIADETAFQGKRMPFVMGALTFFLPCGFTLTAQSLALLSGSFFQGALIMGFFALGTLPVLFAIGVASVKLTERKTTTALFMKAAGALVLFFALINVNSQFNLIGWPSFSNLTVAATAAKTSDKQVKAADGLAPIVNGKQVIKMSVSSRGYTPNTFKVRAGTPVLWEMTDKGGGGCASSIVARNFFSETVYLTPDEPTTKEFTPTMVGKFRFTCSMGMYSGTIEVVEQ